MCVYLCVCVCVCVFIIRLYQMDPNGSIRMVIFRSKLFN